MTSRIVTTDSS